MYYVLYGVVALLVVWAFGSYLVVRNIEEPAYTVLEKKDGYEVREYDTYIVAQTSVTGEYSQALGEGFRIIADYIFGNNTTNTSIAMTAPVLESSSEQIAMTVPVLSQQAAEKRSVVSFVLPSKYTLETLPKPNNAAVELRGVPSRKVAVRRFTWYATEARVEKQKAVLVERLTADGVRMLDLSQVAQYNPPLSFPLTRRNEILITIE